jgi:hypothetical protein
LDETAAARDSVELQTGERGGMLFLVLLNNAVSITYVARMGELRNAYRTRSDSLKGRYHLVALNVDWRIIFR